MSINSYAKIRENKLHRRNNNDRSHFQKVFSLALGIKDSWYIKILDTVPNTKTGEDKSSTDSSDIRKCLRAGIVPDCYKDILATIVGDDGKSVIEKGYHYETVGTDDPMSIDSMTDDEMVELARRGYFVRDIRHDKVICPTRQIIKRKSKKSGVVRYCNKLSCSNCMFRG